MAIQTVEDPGRMVASGTPDATVDGEQDRLDADVGAAKQARYISAFEPQVADLNERNSATAEVVALLNQLEDLDATAQRSVASEVESAIEGGACLTDDVGRTRILDICREVRQNCAKLNVSETRNKLEKELAQATRAKLDGSRKSMATAYLCCTCPEAKCRYRCGIGKCGHRLAHHFGGTAIAAIFIHPAPQNS